MYHHGFYGQQANLDLEQNFEIKEEEEESDQPVAPVKREKRRYRCRKRSPATIERAKVVRRDKANARERRRMNSLNDALEDLRTILPAGPEEPKMTKIETLRKAQDYIASLSFQLSRGSPTSQCCETGSCGSCCSGTISLQSTPYQSPCFPPPHQFYSNPQQSAQMYFHHPHHQSPHFPKS